MPEKIYIPKPLQPYGYQCPNKHYKCMSCSFAFLNKPPNFKDHTGSYYLSSTFAPPVPPKCPSGHDVTITKKNTSDRWNYVCIKCNVQRYFNTEHGVGRCQACEGNVCPRCMGARVPSIEELSTHLQMVSHFEEKSAEQLPDCTCQRPFKLTYTTTTENKKES
jgi:hypothetical protein